MILANIIILDSLAGEIVFQQIHHYLIWRHCLQKMVSLVIFPLPQLSMLMMTTTIVIFDAQNDKAIDDDYSNTTVQSLHSTLICNINPMPGIKFGTHLQQVLLSHHGVDLSLYDEIIDTIKHHSPTH